MVVFGDWLEVDEAVIGEAGFILSLVSRAVAEMSLGSLSSAYDVVFCIGKEQW